MGKCLPSIRNIFVVMVVLPLLVTASKSYADNFIRVKPPVLQTDQPSLNAGSMNSTPKLKKQEPSSFDVGTTQEVAPFPYLPDDETGRLIRQHFNNAAAFGVESEAKFIDSLKALRTKKVEVIRTLMQAYQTVESELYFDRWLITNTLAQLDTEGAIAALGRIAADTIPAEKYDFNKTGMSSVEEEIAIRLAAVRGLSLLARRQHKAADDVLARLVKENVNVAVKRMAIQGYLEAGFDIKTHKSWTKYLKSRSYTNRMNRLKTFVPRKDLPLLEVQPVLPKDLESLKVDFRTEKEKPDYKKTRLPDRTKSDPAPVLEGTPAYLKIKQKQDEMMEGGQ